MTHLSSEDAAQAETALRTAGYFAMERLVEGPDLVRLQQICEAWLNGEMRSSADHMVGGTLHQIFQPSRLEPFLGANAAIERARRLSARVLGDSFLLFDSLICKPPGDPHEVPWHQDAAYQEVPFAPAGSTSSMSTLQFWVALDDVDESNGCMHYLPSIGADGLLPHRVIAGAPDDPRRLLGFAESVHVEPSAIVPIRLGAGGAVAHTLMAPHWTPPNLTEDRPRRVYTFLLCSERERKKFEAVSAAYTL